VIDNDPPRWRLIAVNAPRVFPEQGESGFSKPRRKDIMIYNCGHFAQAFSVLAVAAFSLSATPAISQETGRQEYMNYCSSCHGDTAKGDGEVAQFLSVNTPSLTSLSEQNDGEFPLLEVIQIIDGRSGLGPHGTLMPVWGDRYKEESIRTSGEYGAEVIVRGRILSLATYLQSIQE